MSAFLISQVEVLDPDAWERYRERAAPAAQRYSGRYLVRGGATDVIEDDWPGQGPPPRTLIVAQFPSMERLRAWYGSPEYAQAFGFRAAAVRRRLLFAPGVEPPAGVQ